MHLRSSALLLAVELMRGKEDVKAKLTHLGLLQLLPPLLGSSLSYPVTATACLKAIINLSAGTCSLPPSLPPSLPSL